MVYDVLLVDDEVIFLEFLKTMVDWGKYNCRVCACEEDGNRALEYILKTEPHIAFLDISMPNKDGLQVCEAVRRMNLPTKLIIMTGHSEFSFAHQAIKLNVVDYLLKPFEVDELNKSLEKAIAQIMDERTHEKEKQQIGLSGKSELLVDRIENYLYEHYQEEDLSLNRIALELQFESSYLRRVYKTQKGMTISQKLQAIRIARAKELLDSGVFWNKEICELVGYSDQYYFSKRFKQICGCTPTEYRKSK